MKKQTTTTKTQLRVRTQVQGGEYCPYTCLNQFNARKSEGVDFEKNNQEFQRCVCSCHDPNLDKTFNCSALKS